MASLEMASLGSGNTIQNRAKSRNYQLTLNETAKYEQLLEYLYSLKSLTYLIAAKEIAPTTGHEHIHIYLHFKTVIKLSIRKCCGAHIEICRGTPQQNIDYIKKDGEILEEYGEPPKWGGMRVIDLKNCKSPDELDWKQYNTWKKIHQNDEIELDDFSKEVEVIYIYGPSGIGKTEKAKEIIRENNYTKFSNVKYENGFWIGVGSGRDVALYDDFRDSHMKASEFINFIDYNVHTMNIKGGSCQNNYKLIIITSIQGPKEIYWNLPDEPRSQWLRRMEIINMNETNMKSILDDLNNNLIKQLSPS